MNISGTNRLLDTQRRLPSGLLVLSANASPSSMPALKGSPYEESILRSLRRIIRGVALYNKHLASHYEITGPQLVCLRYLSRMAPTTPSRLAAAASLSKATITGIIDRLEKRGLLTRDRSTTDKRKVNLQLTEAGKELVFTAPPPLQERFARNLAMLARGQQGQLDRMLNQIVQMMEVKDIDAAPILDTAHAMAEPEELPDSPARNARSRGSRTGRPRS